MTTTTLLTDERKAFVESIRDFCRREFGTREQRDRLTGNGEHAHVQSIYERMAELASRYGSVRERPRVHWEWAGRPVVAARRSWVTEMIDMAGGANVYCDLDAEAVRILAFGDSWAKY